MSLKRKDAPDDEGGAVKDVAAETSAVNWRKYLTETNLLISTDATASRQVGSGSFAHALLAPELPLKGPQPFKTNPDIPDPVGRLRALQSPVLHKSCKCHKKKCTTCLSCVERHCTCKKGSRSKRAKAVSSDDEPAKEEEPLAAVTKVEAAAKPRKRATTKRLAPSSIRGCTCHRKKCETCRNCLSRHCKCNGKNADLSDGGGEDNDDESTVSGDDKLESLLPPPVPALPTSVAKKRKTCVCHRKKCDLCQNCIARHCDCPPAESDGCSCNDEPKCPTCNHCVKSHCLCVMETLNNKLMNQVLFVNAIADGKLKLGRRDRKDVVKDMKQRGFDLVDNERDFDYLLSLPLSSLLNQEMDTLQEQADTSQEEFVAASAIRAHERALEQQGIDDHSTEKLEAEE
ncbi:hypothetical protein H257_02552 [Aphanomyces astaci]|uniref:Uncharacterized protein n=1 Tax=Aphanomyces astaci TaxID=112090 RepID=W4H3B2_APHAT|nr:hypothetical protein H257_02552 [Aphanomyces astaci]ETV86066.1 hypothetical protein H257_02552 [Aphanomyces astaci]|eukprot:XP_009824538.1 hypothetical protein H257_02552 [Aphanomyces astaci]